MWKLVRSPVLLPHPSVTPGSSHHRASQPWAFMGQTLHLQWLFKHNYQLFQTQSVLSLTLDQLFQQRWFPEKKKTNTTHESSASTFPPTQAAARAQAVFCCTPRGGVRQQELITRAGGLWDSIKHARHTSCRKSPSLWIFVIGDQSHTRPEIWLIKAWTAEPLIRCQHHHLLWDYLPCRRGYRPPSSKKDFQQGRGSWGTFPTHGVIPHCFTERLFPTHIRKYPI